MPPYSVQTPGGFGQRFLLFHVQHKADDTTWVSWRAKMPFEPLKTDEKLDKLVKAKPDMDAVMLAGCGAFVFTALTTYFLGIWPFLAFGHSYKVNVLILDLVCAAVPTVIFGVVMTRKAGLPGACGFVGGTMSVAVFIYLRLKMIVSSAGSAVDVQPEYPSSWAWLIPLVWLAFCLVTAIVSYSDTKES